jgi:hypothetical protein
MLLCPNNIECLGGKRPRLSIDTAMTSMASGTPKMVTMDTSIVDVATKTEKRKRRRRKKRKTAPAGAYQVY